MRAILEGLLFISGDDGITKDKIIDILGIDSNQLNELINELGKEYESTNHGIRIEEINDKIRFVTKVEYKDYYQKLVDVDSDMLTNATLETLAIIAYNQPIVRSQIDEIRGVDSSYHLRKLLLKELIEEKGRSELPGRPILYGTTDRFLDHFGLHSLNELPSITETTDIDEEIDLFDTKYQEN